MEGTSGAQDKSRVHTMQTMDAQTQRMQHRCTHSMSTYYMPPTIDTCYTTNTNHGHKSRAHTNTHKSRTDRHTQPEPSAPDGRMPYPNQQHHNTQQVQNPNKRRGHTA